MIERGQVVWADFGPITDSSPAKRRPALVVQADYLNESRSATAIVVPLTSQLKQAGVPGHVLLEGWRTGLDKDSVAITSQVTTVDRRQLDQALATLSPREMARVDAGLRTALGLTR